MFYTWLPPKTLASLSQSVSQFLSLSPSNSLSLSVSVSLTLTHSAMCDVMIFVPLCQSTCSLLLFCRDLGSAAASIWWKCINRKVRLHLCVCVCCPSKTREWSFLWKSQPHQLSVSSDLQLLYIRIISVCGTCAFDYCQKSEIRAFSCI